MQRANAIPADRGALYCRICKAVFTESLRCQVFLALSAGSVVLNNDFDWRLVVAFE